MTDGSIYATGANDYGQLGDGTTTRRTTLTLMTSVSGKTPAAISSGYDHTVVLMTDGSIYATGYNFYGQLGNGTTTNSSTLTLMTSVSGKTSAAISGRNYHTVVLMTDGSIYATGYNNSGQLGDGTTTRRTTLTPMTNTYSPNTIIGLSNAPIVPPPVPPPVQQSATPSTARLSFSDPSASLLAGQNTYFYTVSGGNLTIPKTPTTLGASPLDISGLTPNTSYTFNFIRDNSSNGIISESSASLLFTTSNAPTVPPPVQQSATPSTARISFSDPSASLLAGSNSYFYTVSGDNLTIPKTPTTLGASPLDISGLTPNTSYTFNFIRDNSTNGIITESSAALLFTTLAIPVSLNFILATSSNAIVSFSDPCANLISGEIRYFYSISGENQSGARSGIRLQDSPFNITNLISDTSYTFNLIRDISNIYTSESITSVDFRTLPAGSNATISSSMVTELLNSGYTLQNIMDNVNAGSTSPVTIILSSDLNNISTLLNNTSHVIYLKSAQSNENPIRITKSS
jgi:hypothetical protein